MIKIEKIELNNFRFFIDEEIKSSSSPDLNWIDNDKLSEQKKTIKTAQYTSIHECISKKQIHLTHLWVKLLG